MKKSQAIHEGNCALCGEFKILSFEHIPPKKAFNNKPIAIQGYDHLANQSSPLYKKKSRLHQGFGSYSLCETCNNTTGAWYANDFSDFVHKGMEIIKSKILRGENHSTVPYAIEGEYKIKPLNVIKQIMTMFMSADKSGHLQSQPDLVEFILQREKTGLPRKFKVFLYSTLSPNKRMMGAQIVYVNGKINHWSEINFQPFGYLLAENSDAAHKDMVDISQMGDFKYNQEIQLKMTTPYLGIDTWVIGHYS